MGVVMGNAGAEVAKEAVHMILTHDNVTSIEDGVEEGRILFESKQIICTIFI